MRVIRLEASNVKRLKAVDITPDAHFQIIGGRNAQGKSSVLDALWLALAGRTAAKETIKPIRDGESSAEVTVTLDDKIVTRKWTPSGSTVKVTTLDGASFSSPQKVLDDLIGSLALDPLAFSRLPQKEQVNQLLSIVDLGDLDLDAFEQKYKAIYDERTAVNKQEKAFGEIPELIKGVPAEEVSASELIGQINAAMQRRNQRIAALDRHQKIEAELQAMEERAAQLRAEAEQIIESTPQEDVDIEALNDRLRSVETTNSYVRHNKQVAEATEQKAALARRSAELSNTLTTIKEAKEATLAQAVFPVEGLSLDHEYGVTFNGQPLSQASGAERVRISTKIAMAMNPDLRVLRITDGSLLDDEMLNELQKTVTDADYQLWIERVGNGDAGAIIIEDGEVAQ